MRLFQGLLLITLVIGAGTASAAVRLKREAQYPETPVQKCLHVENFEFDRAPNPKTGGKDYLLGWKMRLKSSCLKQNNISLFYELKTPAGESLSYQPLGKVSGKIMAGDELDIADTAVVEQDPVGLTLAFHILQKTAEGRQHDYPLYEKPLVQVVAKVQPDPVLEQKREAQACFPHVVVESRAIAENWHRTYLWWRLTTPEPTACKQALFSRAVLKDEEGKVIEETETFSEILNQDVKQSAWHKQGLKTVDYQAVKHIEVQLGIHKNLAENAFKKWTITPPELENW